MAQLAVIEGRVREGTGKGPARAARRGGRVPAVIYGGDKAPEIITVETREIARGLGTGTFESTLIEVDLGGTRQRVLPREVQVDPVTDVPIHVDFLRLPEGATITVMVPVNFIDEEQSPGLKRGGVLNIVRREIELKCLADAIPESLSASLADLEINDSIHISHIELPEGASLTITDRDFTVATVASPTVVRDEEAAEAEEEELMEGEEVEEGAEAEEGEAAEAEEGKAKPGEKKAGDDKG